MSKQSIADIKNIFSITPIENIQSVINDYKIDDRTGVKNLIASYEKKYQKYLDELKRLEAMSIYEKKYTYCNYITGIDEAGRGPLAGPVVAGAVVLPKDMTILYINDSKKLSESKRELLYKEITEKAIAFSVGIESAATIDDYNILQATYKAMQSAIDQLQVKPDLLLIDAVTLTSTPIKQEGIIGGDGKSISIAAASIIAKVTRDHMMLEYHKLYPEYGFAKHKGYGTAEHIEAIKKYGPCPIHRRSFIKNILNAD